MVSVLWLYIFIDVFFFINYSILERKKRYLNYNSLFIKLPYFPIYPTKV